MTNDEDYEISEEPPRDDQGHPVHPEKGYRICGATKSDRTTPTDHGRERDDYDYCLQRAGWGKDREVGPCRKHPVTGEQWGKSNPNYDDGSYSEFEDLREESLTEREQEMLDALDLEKNADQFAEDVVKEAYIKYLRTGDDRFLREARQWAKEFGVIETPAEQLEVDAQVESETEHSLDEGTKEIAREVLRQRREADEA
jgi:hypothetical protein